jgi:hypothetical protein
LAASGTLPGGTRGNPVKHARHLPRPPDPGRRRRAIVLGAVISAFLLIALLWSIWRWPVTCERYIETASPRASDRGTR